MRSNGVLYNLEIEQAYDLLELKGFEEGKSSFLLYFCLGRESSYLPFEEGERRRVGVISRFKAGGRIHLLFADDTLIFYDTS